jgi:hypothetical protein
MNLEFILTMLNFPEKDKPVFGFIPEGCLRVAQRFNLKNARPVPQFCEIP